jgi:hypothetical protein
MKTAIPQPGLILAIDLGKYKSVACVYETATAEVRFRTLCTNAAELLDLLGRARHAVVVIETGASAGWVYDLCTAAKVPCHVANTSSEAWKFQHSKRKTDRDDARPRGTEEFLERDTLVSQSSMPRQRCAGPDPVNLFGATSAWTPAFERLRRPKKAKSVNRHGELLEKA